MLLPVYQVRWRSLQGHLNIPFSHLHRVLQVPVRSVHRLQILLRPLPLPSLLLLQHVGWMPRHPQGHPLQHLLRKWSVLQSEGYNP